MVGYFPNLRNFMPLVHELGKRRYTRQKFYLSKEILIACKQTTQQEQTNVQRIFDHVLTYFD